MSENQEPNNVPNKQQENGGVAQKAQETAQKAKKVKDTAQKVKKIAHAVKNISASGPLMYVLFWVLVVIVILIIIIGVLMFLITMPGMVMAKLKELFQAIGDAVAAFFGADTTKQINKVELFETLDYIEDMGWDLKGEGFLTGYYKLGDEKKIKDELEDLDFDFKNKSYEPDPKQGVVRDGDDKIVLAKSDFMFTYIMSDNYVYTLKNKNIATERENDGFWTSVAKKIKTGSKKVANFLLGPVMGDSHKGDMDKFGTGLIALYYDKSDGSAKGFGEEGDPLIMENIWENGVIEISAKDKPLLIENDGWFNNNNPIKFSLDGWTGRYGMPLEFLLSVHKATMMPDLAYDMVYTFATNVNIYLHEVQGQVRAAYKKNNGEYLTKLRKAMDDFEGTNWFSALLNWFDDLHQSEGEAIGAYEAGLDMIATSKSPCGCELDTVYYTEDQKSIVKKDGEKWYYFEKGKLTSKEYKGNRKEEKRVVECCDYCQEVVGVVVTKLTDNADYNYYAYAPYIANVQRHWYRDVYFVKEGNKDFVEYDYDYEALMKERWTLYETYTDKDEDKGTYKYNPDKVGEFIYFIIDAERKIQTRKWSVCIV